MINRQYKIVKKIGEGRSQVILCRDTDLDDKEVAIKILSPNSPEEEKKYFKDEFLTLRKINHPNIIKCFSYGTAYEISNPAFSTYEGSIFFVLEYFNGIELLDYPGVKEEKILSVIVKKICEALFYLHQSGYVYYDLKPENILIYGANGNPDLKLIDLGFTARPSGTKQNIKGTAEYIAPELLKGEQHNHTVDLYSLGIILYRIIYGQFPFSASSEIGIYKAQLENEFNFPETGYPGQFVTIIKKLLKKNPSERYSSALQVIRDLGFDINEEITSNFTPVKSFTARKDILSILKKYIQDKNSTEVFNIKGSEGSGKTSLFQEAAEVIDRSVLIENENRDPGLKFIKKFLKKVTYADCVYNRLTQQEKEKFYQIIEDHYVNLKSDLKSYFISLSLRNNFTIILDDFDTYDDFTSAIMSEIIPILQSNNIKVIISESSEKRNPAEFIYNRREIHLPSFMENELTEFVETSYGPFFPKADLKKAILLYADLLPGSIEAFIKDLLFFNIIRYSESGILIEFTEENKKLLKSSHQEIYQVRLDYLSPIELQAVKIISCFKLSPGLKILSLILNFDEGEVKKIIEGLQKKNILISDPKNTALIFSSSGMKDYIYSTIMDKAALHLEIAGCIKLSYDKLELARQYELAGLFEESYQNYRKEIDARDTQLSLPFIKNLLQHIINFPLDPLKIRKLKIELAGVLYALSDYRSAMDIISEFEDQSRDYETAFINGGSLIGMGELQKGVTLLKELLPRAPQNKRPGLMLSIASAEFDLNNFAAAESICNKILNDILASVEEVGKSLNLLGLIKIYTQNDFDKALSCFLKAENVYMKGKHLFGVAQMQNNIANIYNMRGDFEKAEVYWNKSLKINLEIGNLEQEATLLLNFGVLYFEKQEYDKTIHFYKRALSIYSTLGNRLSENIVQVNLGEIYLVLCEYDEALNYLENAAYNLNMLKNANEESEALYLLARLYLTVGDPSSFDKIIERYSALHKEQLLIEKNNTYLRYLRLISDYHFGRSKPDLHDMRLIRNYFLEQKEKLKFIESSFYIIDLLLQQDNYNEAFLELSNQSLVENCRNMSAEAERNYYLGILAEEAAHLKIEPAIDYFQRAYELAEELNIGEYTWKILFSLTKNYSDRGNVMKAEEYAAYCSSLIHFIAGKIKDDRLKDAYLNDPGRKFALEKIKHLKAHT